jgi:hypothetical protein
LSKAPIYFRVLAQDLTGDGGEDAAWQIRVDGGRNGITGSLIDRVATGPHIPGDFSDPGLIFAGQNVNSHEQ